jgi:hypothetical protein
MKQNQFTPGPWKTYACDVTNLDGRQIAITYNPHGPSDLPTYEMIANARLIAAAPDLLKFVELLAGQKIENSLGHLVTGLPGLIANAKKLVKQARTHESIR